MLFHVSLRIERVEWMQFVLDEMVVDWYSSVQKVKFSPKAIKHHRSLSRSGSNLVASLTPPTVGDAGSHTRHSGHIYQEPYSSFRNAPFPSIRRARQRGLAFISSVGSNSSVENSGFYGFSVSSGSMNRSNQDGDSIGRRFDRFYGWVREGFAPLPWIPVDGEPW